MKKKNKTVLAGIVCVVMLGLTACGSKDSDESGASEDNVTTETKGMEQDTTEKKQQSELEGNEVEKSEVVIAPVEGMTDEFARGVDISTYVVQKEAGVVFKDFEGNELGDMEFFQFLAECGVNWVRIRVWNHPYNAQGQGYGGGNSDIEKAVVIGKLATKAGMKVLIDFHYSDFWADPSKQMVPLAWDGQSLEDKKILLADYTTESLNRLLDEGVDVRMVQIGNEINNGLAGETDAESVYALLQSASGAVRAVSKDIQIAVHYTNPEKAGFIDFAAKLEEAGLDYDVFGVSYYPYWHGTLENLSTVLKTIREENGKDVMIMETSYAYTKKDGDGFSNSIGEGAKVDWRYDVSVQGQAEAVRDVANTVCQAGGMGVFYWEPAWIPVNVWTQGSGDARTIYESNKAAWETYGCGWASSYSAEYDPEDAGKWYGGSSWDNQALFAFDGTPLESLKVFQYMLGGDKKTK